MEQAILSYLPDNDGSMSEYYPNMPALHRCKSPFWVSKNLAKATGNYMTETKALNRAKGMVKSDEEYYSLANILHMVWVGQRRKMIKRQGFQEASFRASFSRALRRLIEKGLVKRQGYVIYKC